MNPERALKNFSRMLEEGDIDHISLTVYYTGIFSSPITSVRELINNSATRKYVFDGNQLAEHIDLLKTINKVELIPTRNISYKDARTHYVFENRGRRIFDITTAGIYKHEDGAFEIIMFINGKKFKSNYILDKIMEPFFP